jgi:hypothetical protein
MAGAEVRKDMAAPALPDMHRMASTVGRKEQEKGKRRDAEYAEKREEESPIFY